MTDVPIGERAARAAAQKKIVRRLGMIVSALSVILVVIVFFLIVRNERAHDEKTCPFAAGETRTLGDASVREESRSCMPDVEERRYLVSRAGKPEYELGRKRLPAVVFREFSWALRPEKGGLVLDLFIAKKLESEFHEEDAVKP